MFLLRAVAIWLVIVCIESGLGTLRTIFLAPRIGDFRARQVGVFVSSAFILAVAYLSIRWIRARSARALVLVGVVWLILTVLFELSLGLVLGLSWQRIAEDYDFRRGGLMPLGLLVLVLSPLIVAKLRGFPASD